MQTSITLPTVFSETSNWQTSAKFLFKLGINLSDRSSKIYVLSSPPPGHQRSQFPKSVLGTSHHQKFVRKLPDLNAGAGRHRRNTRLQAAMLGMIAMEVAVLKWLRTLYRALGYPSGHREAFNFRQSPPCSG
jgi:hypothetical protein